MKRARWSTLASVRRYEKGGRIHQQVHQAPAAIVARGRGLVPRIGPLLVAPAQETTGTDWAAASVVLVGRGDKAWVRARETECPRDVVEVIDAAGRDAPDFVERQVQKHVFGRLRGGLAKAVWIALPPTSDWGRGGERNRRSRVILSATMAIVLLALARDVPVGIEARHSQPIRSHPGLVEVMRSSERPCVPISFCGQPCAATRESLLSQFRSPLPAERLRAPRSVRIHWRPSQSQKLDRPLPRAFRAGHSRLFQERLRQKEGGRD